MPGVTVENRTAPPGVIIVLCGMAGYDAHGRITIMSVKDDIKRLWQEAFGDTKEFVDMYFDSVYTDADAMTLEVDGRMVSSLLLQPYLLRFHGETLPVAYVSGAATRRQSRGKGYMSQLMLNALQSARERGAMGVALIPADVYLYDYYARMDFATVFYADAQRYTSLHQFPGGGEYYEAADIYDPEVMDAFMRMESERPCGILHSRRDFQNILDDLNIDNGRFVCMRSVADDSIAAMGWAAYSGSAGRVVVKDLLGDGDAKLAVLRAMRAKWKDMPFTLLAPASEAGSADMPDDTHTLRRLMPRGMLRLVNPQMALQAIASAYPALSLTVRLSDHLMPCCAGCYRVDRGTVEYSSDTHGAVDFDVDTDTLVRVLFSSPSTGEMLGLPAQRPHISLMLD